ncbi:STM3941 family protein [Sphingobacterium sp. LRF_L2]|uniref:STM3941 family protein n=1 Tax=Sphingobacterium sp. LRF_L2 TaxID=3369421 RepID=UPI003F618A10
MDKKIVITFNRTRKGFILFVFLFFTFLGLLFILKADSLTTIWIIKSALLLQIIGIVTFLVSSCFILLFLRLSFQKVALIIDEKGITDNSSVGGEAGRIQWEQVVDICNAGTAVLVFIKDPEDFIAKKSGWWNKLSLKMNYRSYGTPIAIPMFALNSYVDTLERQLKEEWESYKQSTIKE